MKIELPKSDSKVEKRTYTPKEAAKILDCHVNTVYRLIKKNAFEIKKIGTDIRILKTSFEDWFMNK